MVPSQHADLAARLSRPIIIACMHRCLACCKAPSLLYAGLRYAGKRDCNNNRFAGQEGFAGNSTPLYMYSNPGAWASLLGVDFVKNNKAKGIDYATMHVYVDQWLCVAEGSTREGQLDFMK